MGLYNKTFCNLSHFFFVTFYFLNFLDLLCCENLMTLYLFTINGALAHALSKSQMQRWVHHGLIIHVMVRVAKS